MPRRPKIRWEYPVVWSDPDVGTLRVRALVNPAAEPDGLAFNDSSRSTPKRGMGMRRLEQLYP